MYEKIKFHSKQQSLLNFSHTQIKVKCKIVLVTTHNAMKTCGGVETKLHAFLTLKSYGSEK